MKSEMEKQLSQLPPDKRAQMEEMMRSQGMSLPGSSTKPKNLELQKPGKDESIAGYKSVKYEVYEDGKLIEEIWTSNEVLNNEIDIKKMSNYLQKIKDISENAGGMAFNPEGQTVYKEVFESGFPMKTVDHESEDGIYIEEITKCIDKNIYEINILQDGIREILKKFKNTLSNYYAIIYGNKEKEKNGAISTIFTDSFNKIHTFRANNVNISLNNKFDEDENKTKPNKLKKKKLVPLLKKKNKKTDTSKHVKFKWNF